MNLIQQPAPPHVYTSHYSCGSLGRNIGGGGGGGGGGEERSGLFAHNTMLMQNMSSVGTKLIIGLIL